VAAKRTAAEDAAGDLRLLVDGATVRGGGAPLPALALRTARYREEYARYAREVEASARRWAAARAAVGRGRALLAGGFAASIEVEDQELRLADADAERAAVRDRWLGGWHAALAAERATLAAMRAEAGQLAADERRDTVRAPVGGTVEELARLGVGSFVQGGDVVAVISPDVGLVAELYVAPRDVGLLRPGAPVRLQVDAFNYHDWGLATGRVLTISDDFVTVEGRPMFRVRSTLDPSRLVLRNGTRARVRKGMTLRARFPVARRSVLQLLRDDVNSWLSPFQDGTP
jgi:HlyD family secretion protein